LSVSLTPAVVILSCDMLLILVHKTPTCNYTTLQALTLTYTHICVHWHLQKHLLTLACTYSCTLRLLCHLLCGSYGETHADADTHSLCICCHRLLAHPGELSQGWPTSSKETGLSPYNTCSARRGG